MAVEEPLHAPEPTGSRADLALESEAEPDPERRARGPLDLARVEVRPVGALVRRHPLLLAPEHVRARGEELQIRRIEGLLGVGARERVGRRQPGAARVGLSRAGKLACHRRILSGRGRKITGFCSLLRTRTVDAPPYHRSWPRGLGVGARPFW